MSGHWVHRSDRLWRESVRRENRRYMRRALFFSALFFGVAVLPAAFICGGIA